MNKVLKLTELRLVQYTLNPSDVRRDSAIRKKYRFPAKKLLTGTRYKRKLRTYMVYLKQGTKEDWAKEASKLAKLMDSKEVKLWWDSKALKELAKRHAIACELAGLI